MQTLNPNFKGATVGPLSEVIYSNQQNSKNFTFNVLPEPLFSIPVAMYLPKNHFLTNEINAKISILHSAGLIKRWTAEYLQESPKSIPSMGPKQLNVNQLFGILYVFIGGCMLSILFLMLEIIIKVKIKIFRL